MNDPIRRFVSEHREEFDDLRPSSGLLAKIQQEVVEVKNASRRSRIYRLCSLSVAASVLIGLSIHFYPRSEDSFAIEAMSKNTAKVSKSMDQTANAHRKKVPAILPADLKAVPMVVGRSDNSIPPQLNLAVSRPANVADEIPSLLNDELSSSARISGLHRAEELSNLGAELIEAIVKRATTDQNSNVRLAALEVIVSRLDQPGMPGILERIFLNQDDPFVQSQLIDVIANIDTERFDPDIKNRLIALTENPETKVFVKDRAYAVLMKH